jgi:hypothetical protein
MRSPVLPRILLLFAALRVGEAAFPTAPTTCSFTDGAGAAQSLSCNDVTQATCRFCAFACPIECVSGDVSTRTLLPRASATLSTTSGGLVATNCIDGEVPPGLGTGGVCSSTSEATPWLRIDLGAIYDITQMRIHNRGGSFNNDLGSHQVWVRSTEDSPPPPPPALPPAPPGTDTGDPAPVPNPDSRPGWEMCASGGAAPDILAAAGADLPDVVTVDCARTAQIIELMLVQQNDANGVSTGNRILHLKEIEIFGTIAEAALPNMLPLVANEGGTGTTCGGITTVISPAGCSLDPAVTCTSATPDSNCPFNLQFCLELPVRPNECGMLAETAATTCAGWGECGGLICPTAAVTTGGGDFYYCYARRVMDLSLSDSTGFTGYYKRPREPQLLRVNATLSHPSITSEECTGTACDEDVQAREPTPYWSGVYCGSQALLFGTFRWVGTSVTSAGQCDNEKLQLCKTYCAANGYDTTYIALANRLDASDRNCGCVNSGIDCSDTANHNPSNNGNLYVTADLVGFTACTECFAYPTCASSVAWEAEQVQVQTGFNTDYSNLQVLVAIYSSAGVGGSQMSVSSNSNGVRFRRTDGTYTSAVFSDIQNGWGYVDLPIAAGQDYTVKYNLHPGKTTGSGTDHGNKLFVCWVSAANKGNMNAAGGIADYFSNDLCQDSVYYHRRSDFENQYAALRVAQSPGTNAWNGLNLGDNMGSANPAYGDNTLFAIRVRADRYVEYLMDNVVQYTSSAAIPASQFPLVFGFWSMQKTSASTSYNIYNIQYYVVTSTTTPVYTTGDRVYNSDTTCSSSYPAPTVGLASTLSTEIDPYFYVAEFTCDTANIDNDMVLYHQGPGGGFVSNGAKMMTLARRASQMTDTDLSGNNAFHSPRLLTSPFPVSLLFFSTNGGSTYVHGLSVATGGTMSLADGFTACRAICDSGTDARSWPPRTRAPSRRTPTACRVGRQRRLPFFDTTGTGTARTPTHISTLTSPR